MTPAAMTPAAQRARAKRAAAPAEGSSTQPSAAPPRTQSGPSAPSRGHRRTASPAPTRARRVSGPTRGRIPAPVRAPAGPPTPTSSAPAKTRPASRTTAPRARPRRRPAPALRRRALRVRSSIALPSISLPSIAPRWHRRSSGPATAPKRPLHRRVLAGIGALPDHALVDRLVRGRSWIPVLGVMLAGIVAMQVEVLKLGASMGRSIELGTQLQAHNEALRASVASLADDQRIERLAAKQGMVMPAPSDIGFLSADPANVPKAVNTIHAPAPATFLSASTLNGAVTTAPVTTSDPSATGSSSVTSGSSSSSVGASGTSSAASALSSGSATGSGSTSSSSGSGSSAAAVAAPLGVTGQSHP